MLQRQVAYKVQAGDIQLGNPVFEGERFSALESNGNKISRINILGNIIDKYTNPDKKYCNLTLDDGSGQIRIKAFSDQFDMLNKNGIGDTVSVIGLLRHFNDEIYIMPEVVRSVDPRWLHIRRLELGKRTQKTEVSPTSPTPTNPTNQTNPTTPATSTKQITPKQTEQTEQTKKTENSPLKPQESFDAVKITQEKIGTSERTSEQASEQTNNQKIESPKLQALELIKKEKEIEITKLSILMSIGMDKLNPLINDLITEGEIYELKPGFLCSVN